MTAAKRTPKTRKAVKKAADLAPKELKGNAAGQVRGGVTALQQMQHETQKGVIGNIRA